MVPQRVHGGYREFEHTADLGFDAWGDDLSAVLRAAAGALTSVLAGGAVRGARRVRRLRLTSDDAEGLMHEWLDAILRLFNLRGLVLGRCAFLVLTETRLDARVWVAPLDGRRRRGRHEVKGVTWHGFRVRRRRGGWETRFLLDV